MNNNGRFVTRQRRDIRKLEAIAEDNHEPYTFGWSFRVELEGETRNWNHETNLERYDGRHHVFFSHGFCDVIGNGAINAIHAPTTQQHQLWEVAQIAAEIKKREAAPLWFIHDRAQFIVTSSYGKRCLVRHADISVWRGISKGRRQPVSSPTELQVRDLSLYHFLLYSFQIINYTCMQEMTAYFVRKTHIYSSCFLFLTFFFKLFFFSTWA